jgi:hypothetical protein
MEMIEVTRLMEEYFKTVTPEQFEKDLIDAGIEECPFKADIVTEQSWVASKKVGKSSMYMQKNELYNDGKYGDTKYRSNFLSLVA